jgi:sulfate permease, SulP family
VLDLEATNQMDTTSADALADLLGALRQRRIDLYLVRVMWSVRKVLRRSGFMAELGEDHVWHSISQGVREARRAHGLTHVPAPDGLPGTEQPAVGEGKGEEAAEEHIVARSSDSIQPERHGERL